MTMVRPIVLVVCVAALHTAGGCEDAGRDRSPSAASPPLPLEVATGLPKEITVLASGSEEHQGEKARWWIVKSKRLATYSKGTTVDIPVESIYEGIDILSPKDARPSRPLSETGSVTEWETASSVIRVSQFLAAEGAYVDVEQIFAIPGTHN